MATEAGATPTAEAVTAVVEDAAVVEVVAVDVVEDSKVLRQHHWLWSLGLLYLIPREEKWYLKATFAGVSYYFDRGLSGV